MSTRSIIIVHGDRGYSDIQVYRLYKHSDGYPAGNLKVIKNAIQDCQRLIQEDFLKYKGREEPRSINPAMLAGALVGAATTVFGMGAYVEETYPDSFKPAHLGIQCDLEWIYIIDVNKMTLKIYGGGFTGKPPQLAYKRGPVTTKTLHSDDPEIVTQLVQAIEKLGFKIKLKPAKSRKE